MDKLTGFPSSRRVCFGETVRAAASVAASHRRCALLLPRAAAASAAQISGMYMYEDAPAFFAGYDEVRPHPLHAARRDATKIIHLARGQCCGGSAPVRSGQGRAAVGWLRGARPRRRCRHGLGPLGARAGRSGGAVSSDARADGWQALWEGNLHGFGACNQDPRDQEGSGTARGEKPADARRVSGWVNGWLRLTTREASNSHDCRRPFHGAAR